ncbi:MAG TPA: sensor histidine kinase, partial [Clostridia bacterium]|nr:sensor histidine kinase [Clostridia bacterium]
LVDNVIEHAYPDGKGGLLQVTAVNDNDTYTLTVADRGVGLPENIDIGQSSSLGFMLVQTLVMQVEGKVEVERENGTLVKLVFRCRE